MVRRAAILTLSVAAISLAALTLLLFLTGRQAWFWVDVSPWYYVQICQERRDFSCALLRYGDAGYSSFSMSVFADPINYNEPYEPSGFAVHAGHIVTPAWFPPALLGAYPVWACMRGPVRRWWRRRRGRCTSCGYMLYGLPEPRCPECGTAVAQGGARPSRPRSPAHRRKARASVFLGLLCTSLLGWCVVWAMSYWLAIDTTAFVGSWRPAKVSVVEGSLVASWARSSKVLFRGTPGAPFDLDLLVWRPRERKGEPSPNPFEHVI